MARPTRRAFLGAAAALGATVVAACSSGKKKPATFALAQSKTIKDVRHVVILMQENRSFDHYYGTLAGVRGLADKQALQFADGASVFQQPDAARKSLGPWRMDTTQTDAQDATDLDHSWAKTHVAWNGGAWNQWIQAKTEQTMGYFTRADLPWQYALADAFTICDAYHCSLQGPTTPNRLFHWTGTNDPQGKAGGPVIENPPDYVPAYHWTTYPERLQQAGVTWRVYANDEVGDGGYEHGWVGDYGDNPLWLFQAYHDALASADPKQQDLANRASLRKTWKPDSGQGQNVDHVLSQFISDCKADALPTVSWVVAPYLYCEHPQARPVDGATYLARVLKAIWDNPALWASTAVIVNYDENDGYFDHVPPPFPPAGTADEYINDLPIGLGPRVPAMVISPWSRGGWVNSQVFDHTSVLRFLELVTGVAEPNISAWRREVCGDLTSCFDFTSFDLTVPALPDLTKLTTQANAARSRPKPVPPATATAPTVETATRRYRPLPYAIETKIAVDRSAGTVTMTLTNGGRATASILAYSNNASGQFRATPVLVPARGQASFVAPTTNGSYDFTCYGPNRFVRRCAGGLVAGPSVQAVAAGNALALQLNNDGSSPASFTVTPNDYGGQTQTVSVAPDGLQPVNWPTVDGWYDVTVTAAGGLTYRFAGRIEAS